MKRKITIFFVLIFFLLFFPLSKNQAQTTIPSPKLTIRSLTNNNPGFDILVDLLKIMLGMGGTDEENNSTTNNNNSNNNPVYPSIITPFITINPSDFSDNNVTSDNNGLVYYSQCKGPYDNYPLPQGGTLCKAGCGPTTVAMIVASYIDKNINPPKIVEEYKKSGYYLGSSGSYYSDAENIIKKYGLKTTYIFSDNKPKTIDQIINNFGQIIKNYQNAGWTFFALANFCNNGCGHYFWIIKIDEELNIWAYDPAYDIKLPKPINHKVRYPFPKFRAIFGVKK